LARLCGLLSQMGVDYAVHVLPILRPSPADIASTVLPYLRSRTVYGSEFLLHSLRVGILCILRCLASHLGELRTSLGVRPERRWYRPCKFLFLLPKSDPSRRSSGKALLY
jgi:hypothetical protein